MQPPFLVQVESFVHTEGRIACSTQWSDCFAVATSWEWADPWHKNEFIMKQIQLYDKILPSSPQEINRDGEIWMIIKYFFFLYKQRCWKILLVGCFALYTPKCVMNIHFLTVYCDVCETKTISDNLVIVLS